MDHGECDRFMMEDEMPTMTSPDKWAEPIEIEKYGAAEVQVREGGPILVCQGEPEHDLDGFEIKEGQSKNFIWSARYPNFCIKTKPGSPSASLYVGGVTMPG